MTNKPNIYIAFLRGINVGGNNKISMTELKTSFEKLGFDNVQTYGNSGNIIFTSLSSNAHNLEDKIAKALATKYSIPITVFVRSINEMRKVIELIPNNWKEGLKRKYDIIFLQHSIDNPKIIQTIKPKTDIEELLYYPGVLFWSVNISDFSKSSTIKIVGTKLYQKMTIRSPGVIRKLYLLMNKLEER